MPILDLLKTQIKSYPKNRQSNRQKPEIRTKAHQPTVLRSLQLRGREVCGALTIGTGSAKACIDILGASKGQCFIALATPPGSFDEIPAGHGRWQKLIPALMRIVAGNISLTLRARRKGVKTKFIWGGSALHNDVGPMIYREFLPGALAGGQYKPSPEPTTVGHGLELIPEALERQRKGVSARKLVVTLGPR